MQSYNDDETEYTYPFAPDMTPEQRTDIIKSLFVHTPILINRMRYL